MTSHNDATISTLNNLLEICHDGEQGFTTAAEGADSTDLKRVFSSYAAQRRDFARELEGAVTSLGGKPAEMGHVAGALHRGWMNIKTAVTGNDDLAILNECERGEDEAKQAYTDALKEALPSDMRALVERQAGEVLKAHDRIRDLRDRQRAMDKAAR